MTKEAREFQILLWQNGAMIDPPDPNLFGSEPNSLFNEDANVVCE